MPRPTVIQTASLTSLQNELAKLAWAFGSVHQQLAGLGSSCGASTGLGSLAGNLLAGRNFSDSAKAGLISGATAGTFRGISNKMAGKTFMGDATQSQIADDAIAAEAAKFDAQIANKGISTDAIQTPFSETTVGQKSALIDQAAFDKLPETSPNLLQRTTAKIGEVIPTPVKKIIHQVRSKPIPCQNMIT